MVSNTSTQSFITVAAVLLLLSVQGDAFSVRPSALLTNSKCFGRMTHLQMSTDNEEEQPVGLPPLPSDAGKAKVVEEIAPPQPQAVVSNAATSSAVEEEETTSYPIDLPSPVLLSTSMVLAISSVGKNIKINDPVMHIFCSNLILTQHLLSFSITCNIHENNSEILQRNHKQ